MTTEERKPRPSGSRLRAQATVRETLFTVNGTHYEPYLLLWDMQREGVDTLQQRLQGRLQRREISRYEWARRMGWEDVAQACLQDELAKILPQIRHWLPTAREAGQKPWPAGAWHERLRPFIHHMDESLRQAVVNHIMTLDRTACVRCQKKG